MTTYAHDRDRTSPRDADDVEQHPLLTSVVLHLLPGVVLAAAFYLTGPLAISAGYPGIAAGIAAAAIIIVGGELGWLLREGHRRTGSWSIRGALPYRPGRFTGRTALLCAGLLTWAFLAAALLGSVSGSLKDSFFSWIPAWARDPLPASFAETGSSTAQAVTAVGYLVVLVVAAPLVEELYFRGYLLPRLERFRAWAPLMNVSLFAVYHLWKPWDALTLIVVLGPVVYAVYRLKDVRVGIAVHIALNGLGWLLNTAPTLLAGPR